MINKFYLKLIFCGIGGKADKIWPLNISPGDQKYGMATRYFKIVAIWLPNFKSKFEH